MTAKRKNTYMTPESEPGPREALKATGRRVDELNDHQVMTVWRSMDQPARDAAIEAVKASRQKPAQPAEQTEHEANE